MQIHTYAHCTHCMYVYHIRTYVYVLTPMQDLSNYLIGHTCPSNGDLICTTNRTLYLSSPPYISKVLIHYRVGHHFVETWRVFWEVEVFKGIVEVRVLIDEHKELRFLCKGIVSNRRSKFHSRHLKITLKLIMHRSFIEIEITKFYRDLWGKIFVSVCEFFCAGNLLPNHVISCPKLKFVK